MAAARPPARRALIAGFLVALGLVARPSAAVPFDMGHKTLGTVGLDAGQQPDAGLYFGERALFYESDAVFDRFGNELPVGLDLNAFGNALGALWVARLPMRGAYFNAGFSVPIAHVTANVQTPLASIDQFGLGDVYVQPFKLGWRVPYCDAGFGLAFYAPTGQPASGAVGGIGRGQWTEEYSLPLALYFDGRRSWRLSMLTSYEVNSRKTAVDITRGDTAQIQGGFGTTIDGLIDIGVIGYAEWQARNDGGTALPAVLQGARDRAFGVGPELDFLIPQIRSSILLRYSRDVLVATRPLGQTLVIGFTFLGWKPPGARE